MNFVELKNLPVWYKHSLQVGGFCEACQQHRLFYKVPADRKAGRLRVRVVRETRTDYPTKWQQLAVKAEFCATCGWFDEALAHKSGSSQGKRQRIFELDQFECVYCGRNGQLTLDHLLPRSKGGSDDDTNLVTACLTCNLRKANGQPPPLRYGRYRPEAF